MERVWIHIQTSKYFFNISHGFIAILKALDIINNYNLIDTIILTNSFSTINNIKNTHKTPNINTQIQNYIHNLHKNYFKIKIFWIPGHFNFNGNERANQAAKNATTFSQSSLIQVIFCIDVLNLIKNKCTVIWHHQWASKSSKLHKIKQHIHHWPFPPELSREFEVIILPD